MMKFKYTFFIASNATKSYRFEIINYVARWQSGDAAACKAVNSGSIPLRASKSKIFL